MWLEQNRLIFKDRGLGAVDIFNLVLARLVAWVRVVEPSFSHTVDQVIMSASALGC